MIFKADISSSYLNFEILINGFPLMKSLEDLGVLCTYPINHLIANGKNKITISLFPMRGEILINQEAHIKVNIEEGNDISGSISYPGTEFRLNKDSDRYECNIEVNLRNNFDYYYFKSSPFIDDDKTRLALRNYFQMLWGLFQSKNVPELLRVFKRRTTEYSIAFDREFTSYENEVGKSLSNLLNDPNNELNELVFDKLFLRFYCDNRIATFEDVYGNSAFLFSVKDPDGIIDSYYPIYVCLDNNLNIIPIR